MEEFLDSGPFRFGKKLKGEKKQPVQPSSLSCSKCHQVAQLDVSWCPISDEGLRHLSLGCPKLERLWCKGCRNITSSGIGLIAQACKKLTLININYCGSVSCLRAFDSREVLISLRERERVGACKVAKAILQSKSPSVFVKDVVLNCLHQTACF